MSSIRSFLLAPLLPLLLQGVAAAGLFWLADVAYGGPRRVGEGFEVVALHALLVLFGPIAGALAVVGLYRLHRYQPMGRAIAATLLFVPSLLLASVGICAALVFAGLA